MQVCLAKNAIQFKTLFSLRELLSLNPLIQVKAARY